MFYPPPGINTYIRDARILEVVRDQKTDENMVVFDIPSPPPFQLLDVERTSRRGYVIKNNVLQSLGIHKTGGARHPYPVERKFRLV